MGSMADLATQVLEPIYLLRGHVGSMRVLMVAARHARSHTLARPAPMQFLARTSGSDFRRASRRASRCANRASRASVGILPLSALLK